MTEDIAVDENREVFVGPDGDLATVDGTTLVEQSVGLAASSAVRPLIGEPIRSSTYERAQQALTEAFQRESTVENVQRVEITSVNKSAGTVDVEVFVSYDESFEATITP
jgi:hypothetical protein